MVTRAELAAQRAAGIPQDSSSLAALKRQHEVGLGVDELEAVRLQRVEAAAMEAFGASTLIEAQEAIGAAIPGIVTSITLSADFDSPNGAAPQTTVTRTLNVPAGNPGMLFIQTQINYGSGILQVDLAGAGFTSAPTNLSVTGGDSLAFRSQSGGSSLVVSLFDSTTSALLCPPFTITTT